MDTYSDDDDSPTPQELTDLVSAALAKDHDVDQAVRTLLDRDPSPIQAIKALRATTGMDLAEAKAIVDRNLPRHLKEANDRLRIAASESIRKL